MKHQLQKIYKAITLGFVIFTIMNFTVGMIYEYDAYYRSGVLGFYFYLPLLLAVLVNHVAAISHTFIYQALWNPLYFSFSQMENHTYIRTATFATGVIYTSILVYIYYSLNFLLKKLHPRHRVAAYIFAIILLTVISYLIVTATLGGAYTRVCPGCA